MPIGEPFIELTTVDSTNNYAMAQLQMGMASHGTAYFAHHQTAGKGQRGKSWTTNAGENLILSVILQPAGLKQAHSFLLSATIAVACYDFFKRHAGDGTKIKWPNDIYWRDRKTGGILIENSFRNQSWMASIVGIGLNINQTDFPALTTRAGSLKQITGNTYDPVQLSKGLCTILSDYYSLFLEAPVKMIDLYNENLYKRDELVRFRNKNIIFESKVKEVTAQGKLVTVDTITREFDFGEIEWII